MNPAEIRSFRNSLGLSRRDFAPKLYISEPTLERWERGQGAPRELHLRILNRMRESLGSGRPATYFQYDNVSDDIANESPIEDKQLVTETLKSMSIVLLSEEISKDGNDWLLSFSLGWKTVKPLNLLLACEGSKRPTNPVVDFILLITSNNIDSNRVREILPEICFNHGASWILSTKAKGGCQIKLKQRIFKTGINHETIKHVLGNLFSCWNKSKAYLSKVEGNK
ncbi:MAG TPA: hypothetical protein DCZ94_20430 [Lentisphaeria bacterium]|nr:MAG: hypothetical protein A2X48_15190 [Lentisphaerae bacterium GWF2_49_21]HBC89315.1 hypothetical protein [Lentisphaeria bacterium]